MRSTGSPRRLPARADGTATSGATGCSCTLVARDEGKAITVRPSGSGAVTLTLPATTDCEAEGAVCTGDGKMLSERLETTITGP